tara:strand:- start:53 stop:385 length:333 start_codon:yes stop_codon:yes gene_type:complete
MKFLKFVVWCGLIIILLVFFVSNSDVVSVNLIPSNFIVDEIIVKVPLFVVIIFTLFTGLLWGYFFEYFRGAEGRKRARRSHLAENRLNKELKELRRESDQDGSDILRLIK